MTSPAERLLAQLHQLQYLGDVELATPKHITDLCAEREARLALVHFLLRACGAVLPLSDALLSHTAGVDDPAVLADEMASLCALVGIVPKVDALTLLMHEPDAPCRLPLELALLATASITHTTTYVCRGVEMSECQSCCARARVFPRALFRSF